MPMVQTTTRRAPASQRCGPRFWLLLIVPLGLVFPSSATGQVAATVNGAPIDAADVELLLRESYGKKKIHADALPHFQARALEQVIQRRLVSAHLVENKLGVGPEEIEAALKEFGQKLERDQVTLAEFLKGKGLTETQFRRKVAWQMHWQRYAARQITDEVLQRTFNSQRPQFDGGQVRVAHLLLKPAANAKVASQDLQDRAAAIRRQVADREISFEQAVTRHSQGTKKNGGDLGFIQRRGSMPESFARAAFALKPGEISPPVATPFGVHLIRCLEAKPGGKSLKDPAVRRAVSLHAKRQLFDRVAGEQRRTVQIKYSGKYPYLDPISKMLVNAPQSP